MAVEARRLSTLFSLQSIPNREVMNPFELNGGFCNAYGYGFVPTSNSTEPNAVPGNGFGGDVQRDSLMTMMMKPTTKWIENATAYNGGNDANLLQFNQRKRSRDCITLDPTVSSSTHQDSPACNSSLSFLNQDVGAQIRQQQMDVDRLVFRHMERVRMEIEEKRKVQARRIVETIEQGVAKRLKAKEEERERMGKLNQALEERVRSLAVENQFLRELAQSNEATANVLRTNLEQVLAQVKDGGPKTTKVYGAEIADAESFCERGEAVAETVAMKRVCRMCGEKEPCVLILPCRHLCLCAVCGPAAHACPVCSSAKDGSVHVNMSSS